MRFIAVKHSSGRPVLVVCTEEGDNFMVIFGACIVLPVIMVVGVLSLVVGDAIVVGVVVCAIVDVIGSRFMVVMSWGVGVFVGSLTRGAARTPEPFGLPSRSLCFRSRKM